ncbi:MAG TPA: hypothetical protein VHK26_13720 [Methyloceanibacter sp.]|jgi:hypothetical protein|nr:hypothetical protein [Methyloceanibacter sp.]
MLEVYRDEQNAPPQKLTPALKPRLRSWTGRIWRATPTSFQLMLKLDASLPISSIEDDDLRETLSPFAAELASFALYLDYTDENHLPLPWAVGAFHVDRTQHAFMRFYDFLDTVPAHALVPLLPAAGAQSDLVLSVIPYVLEKNRLIFAITDYDLGFHNRIG